MSRWMDIDTAPFEQPVMVRTDSHVFPAILRKNVSMDDQERRCHQWQATSDKHPADWSDGCCWASNADEIASTQPNQWRHL